MNGYQLDWAYLKFLAEECQAVYTMPLDLEADGVEVRITEDNHGNIVYTFRGTTFDGLDILKDMRTIPWYSSELGGWYHKGFLTGARAILPYILYDLDRHGPDAEYILDGHSKGGAEATDVAALMTALGRPPRALVTYGAPLAGDRSLQRWLRDVDGHRVVNRGDPVPHVPWLLNKLGVFTHHRGETQIDTSINVGGMHSPKNHRINNYINALGYTLPCLIRRNRT